MEPLFPVCLECGGSGYGPDRITGESYDGPVVDQGECPGCDGCGMAIPAEQQAAFWHGQFGKQTLELNRVAKLRSHRQEITVQQIRDIHTATLNAKAAIKQLESALERDRVIIRTLTEEKAALEKSLALLRAATTTTMPAAGLRAIELE